MKRHTRIPTSTSSCLEWLWTHLSVPTSLLVLWLLTQPLLAPFRLMDLLIPPAKRYTEMQMFPIPDNNVTSFSKDSLETTRQCPPSQPLSKIAVESKQCLVSFLILGTRQAGTGLLYQSVSKHPHVLGLTLDAVQAAGQVEFFKKDYTGIPADAVRQEYNYKTMKELSRLHDTHKLDTPNMVVGESSFEYGPSCKAAQEILETCGTCMRIVYVVQNPLDRIVSLYHRHKRLNDNNHVSLHGFVESQLKQYHDKVSKLGANWPNATISECLWNHDFQNAIWSGLYSIHLNRWLRLYGREQIQVVKSENLFQNTNRELKRVLKFLNLDTQELDLNKMVEGSVQKQPASEHHNIDAKQRERLRKIFLPFNEQLQSQFGIDTSDWL